MALTPFFAVMLRTLLYEQTGLRCGCHKSHRAVLINETFHTKTTKNRAKIQKNLHICKIFTNFARFLKIRT